MITKQTITPPPQREQNIIQATRWKPLHLFVVIVLKIVGCYSEATTSKTLGSTKKLKREDEEVQKSERTQNVIKN